MKRIPWVTFGPMQKEIKKEIKDKFSEMYDTSIYIQGSEYEKFNEAIDLVRYGKLDDEKYEIIVEPDKDDETKRRVRVSLMDGVSRNDTFNFLFTDGELFDREFKNIIEEINKEDPNFISEVTFSRMPGVGLVKTSLHESQKGNEERFIHLPFPFCSRAFYAQLQKL